MKHKSLFHFFLSIAVLLLASLACQTVTGILEDDYGSYDESYDYEENDQSNAEDENVPSTQPDLPASQATCPTVTANILSAATQFVDDPNAEYIEEGEEQYIISYAVRGDQISDPYYENVSSDLQAYQDDTTAHQQIWDYFTTLIPLNQRKSVLAEYAVMTDGEGNGLAAVSQTYIDPNLWMLEVDIADSDDKLNLTYTLIPSTHPRSKPSHAQHPSFQQSR